MIEHREVKVGAQKLQDAVRLQDRVLRQRDFLPKARHGFGETSLPCSHPYRFDSSGGKVTRAVGSGGGIAFGAEGERMFVALAVARLTIGRAESMAELRDLEGGPAKLRQPVNERSHDRGLAHTARVTADDYDGHGAPDLSPEIEC